MDARRIVEIEQQEVDHVARVELAVLGRIRPRRIPRFRASRPIPAAMDHPSAAEARCGSPTSTRRAMFSARST